MTPPKNFHYHRIQDSLSGLIESDAKYMDRFGHAFDCLETAGKGNYESHMTSKTEIGEHSRREAIFEAKKAHSLLVSTANRPTRLFILSAIEET